MSLPTSGSMNTVEVLKKQLLSLFGEEENKKKQVIDFTKYGESRIDNVIAEKKKVLFWIFFRKFKELVRCCIMLKIGVIEGYDCDTIA